MGNHLAVTPYYSEASLEMMDFAELVAYQEREEQREQERMKSLEYRKMKIRERAAILKYEVWCIENNTEGLIMPHPTLYKGFPEEKDGSVRETYSKDYVHTQFQIIKKEVEVPSTSKVHTYLSTTDWHDELEYLLTNMPETVKIVEEGMIFSFKNLSDSVTYVFETLPNPGFFSPKVKIKEEIHLKDTKLSEIEVTLEEETIIEVESSCANKLGINIFTEGYQMEGFWNVPLDEYSFIQHGNPSECHINGILLTCKENLSAQSILMYYAKMPRFALKSLHCAIVDYIENYFSDGCMKRWFVGSEEALDGLLNFLLKEEVFAIEMDNLIIYSDGTIYDIEANYFLEPRIVARSLSRIKKSDLIGLLKFMGFIVQEHGTEILATNGFLSYTLGTIGSASMTYEEVIPNVKFKVSLMSEYLANLTAKDLLKSRNFKNIFPFMPDFITQREKKYFKRHRRAYLDLKPIDVFKKLYCNVPKTCFDDLCEISLHGSSPWYWFQRNFSFT